MRLPGTRAHERAAYAECGPGHTSTPEEGWKGQARVHMWAVWERARLRIWEGRVPRRSIATLAKASAGGDASKAYPELEKPRAMSEAERMRKEGAKHTKT